MQTVAGGKSGSLSQSKFLGATEVMTKANSPLARNYTSQAMYSMYFRGGASSLASVPRRGQQEDLDY